MKIFDYPKYLEKISTVQNLKNRDLIWHTAAKWGLEKPLLKLFEYPDILDKVAAIQNDDRRTIWIESAESELWNVCKKADEVLPENIKNIRDFYNKTFSDVAKSFGILLKYKETEEKFEKPSLKEILERRAKEI